MLGCTPQAVLSVQGRVKVGWIEHFVRLCHQVHCFFAHSDKAQQHIPPVVPVEEVEFGVLDALVGRARVGRLGQRELRPRRRERLVRRRLRDTRAGRRVLLTRRIHDNKHKERRDKPKAFPVKYEAYVFKPKHGPQRRKGRRRWWRGSRASADGFLEAPFPSNQTTASSRETKESDPPPCKTTNSQSKSRSFIKTSEVNTKFEKLCSRATRTQH